MQLDGASAVVSGGASGLGAATVAALAARGVSVVVLDRNDWVAEPVIGAEIVRGDVTDPGDVASAIELATTRGPLRVAVNCAGVGSAQRVARKTGSGSIVAADASEFRRVVDINLHGTFHIVSQAAAAMARCHERGGMPADSGIDSIGAIVNTASIAAYEGQVGQAAYAASKAAVVALTFTAARDLAPLRIRVNAIAPGFIDTPLVTTIRDDVRAKLVETVVHPKRPGLPEEYAALAMHLIDNGYLNGETVRLDAASRLPYAPEPARI